jgi:hypothetical protein
MLDLTELLRVEHAAGSSLCSATSVNERRINESIERSSGEDNRTIYFDMYHGIFFKMDFDI